MSSVPVFCTLWKRHIKKKRLPCFFLWLIAQGVFTCTFKMREKEPQET